MQSPRKSAPPAGARSGPLPGVDQPRGPASLAVRLVLPPRRGNGLAQDTFWNAVCNVVSAALSFFVLVVASRCAGVYWCGVIALAFAMSQQFFCIGNFSSGGYQASDVAERHSFSDYAAAKAVTVAAMLAAAGAWLAASEPGRDKTLAFLALLFYQTSEAFSGTVFSRCQQKGRLDAACRIRTAKTLAFAAVYGLVCAATAEPVAALAAAACVHAALFPVWDVPMARLFGPVRLRFPGRSPFAILAANLPVAFYVFLLTFIHNVPRLAVDSLLGEEAFARYSALFMAAFALAVCADFLMNPQIVRLAGAVRAGNAGAALRILGVPLGGSLMLGAAGLALAGPVGIPALSFLFKIDLSGSGCELRTIVAGGAALAVGFVAQSVLVVLRKQFWTVPGLVASSAAVVAVSRPLVARFGLQGAAFSYAAACLCLAVPTALAAAFFLPKAFPRKPAAAPTTDLPPAPDPERTPG